MTASLGSMNAKQAAGEAAVELVRDGMIVGLGTGSTAAFAIKELGRRVEAGLDILGVPTSYQAEFLAIECGVPITSLDECPDIDIAIDGADQIAGFDAIKGGGGAHTREKVVARSAELFAVVVDGTKLSGVLSHPVPIEVLPAARKLVEAQVADLGGTPSLRMGVRKEGPVVTDNGNFIIDANFGTIDDPEEMDGLLSECVGIVEHGIFIDVDIVYTGSETGMVSVMKR